ncbi:MAG: Fe-S cluster assembly ATPase SufC [Actinobacteria bacterium]|nr:Fe-S cluster assembly ATPase SufC [Actinomycetota bacterium]
MASNILEVRNLSVQVEGRKILKNVSFEIAEGETVCLFGPNGAGKSTLLYTLIGYPGYQIVSGEIIFKGKVINDLPVNERANMGFGIAFQHPPKLIGVKLKDLLNLAKNGTSEEEIEELAKRLKMTEFLDRDVNFGFSGGEMKRAEILQLASLKPDLLLLDEPDSGVDVENVELLGKEIQKLLEGRSGLIITHIGYILNFIKADRAIVLYDGKIACQGDPFKILKDIKDKGYKACLECSKC